MQLSPDLREFLDLLNSESVRYLVIGGWAFNRYAEPRFTGDFDVFLSSEDDNQVRLRRVLTAFGYEEVLPPADGPLFRKKIIMIGRPPNRLDLLIEIDGITFEEAWLRREKGYIDEIEVSFISLEDLVKNKRAAGREKDLLDISVISRITGKTKK